MTRKSLYMFSTGITTVGLNTTYTSATMYLFFPKYFWSTVGRIWGWWIHRYRCLLGLLKNQSQWHLVTKLLEIQMGYSHSSIGIVCFQGGAIPWLTTVLGGGCYSMNHELPSICTRTNMYHSSCLSRCIVHLHSQHFSAPVNILRDVTPNLPSKVNCNSIDRDRTIIPTTSRNLGTIIYH